MPRINLLPKEISELIAAGEVVERPASVIKELLENSIDAKSKHITVEIQKGGISYIRITDDGCGITFDDVPLAFKRHATSKIKTGADLDKIATLGFRGEALAATCSVSKTEMFTKTADSYMGTHYVISGGEENIYEETGCPDGTTIIVRDIFYNTPARMKFLKKDTSEGNTVAAVVERAALSHPEIAFKLIREGKQVISTSGDGKLMSAIYSLLGRDFSKSLIEAEGEAFGVKVKGYICKPVFCRQSRNGQYFFLNGRFVHSKTVAAAVEQAYKNSVMVGKFPAYVLNVEVPFETVDVNVHPAKTEIRFADEKRVFDAVYYTVKNAIMQKDTRPEIDVIAKPQKAKTFDRMDAGQYRQQGVVFEHKNIKSETEIKDNTLFINRLNDSAGTFFNLNKIEKAEVSKPAEFKSDFNVNIEKTEEDKPLKTEKEKETVIESNLPKEEEYSCEEEIKFIGEAFSTYIIVQKGNSIFLIDKHAAHERILFNKLKDTEKIETQELLISVPVRLGEDEYNKVLDNLEEFGKSGFVIEDFGNSTVDVTAVPAMLKNCDIKAVVTEAAGSLAAGGKADISQIDRIFHTVACKAAIKAGFNSSDTELLLLAKRVLNNKDVMYCPHGRPVAFEIKKGSLEKHFGRIQ